jgi:hypothetical protein
MSEKSHTGMTSTDDSGADMSGNVELTDDSDSDSDDDSNNTGIVIPPYIKGNRQTRSASSISMDDTTSKTADKKRKDGHKKMPVVKDFKKLLRPPKAPNQGTFPRDISNSKTGGLELGFIQGLEERLTLNAKRMKKVMTKVISMEESMRRMEKSLKTIAEYMEPSHQKKVITGIVNEILLQNAEEEDELAKITTGDESSTFDESSTLYLHEKRSGKKCNCSVI